MLRILEGSAADFLGGQMMECHSIMFSHLAEPAIQAPSRLFHRAR
jgi:hypothetical protein